MNTLRQHADKDKVDLIIDVANADIPYEVKYERIMSYVEIIVKGVLPKIFADVTKKVIVPSVTKTAIDVTSKVAKKAVNQAFKEIK